MLVSISKVQHWPTLHHIAYKHWTGYWGKDASLMVSLTDYCFNLSIIYNIADVHGAYICLVYIHTNYILLHIKHCKHSYIHVGSSFTASWWWPQFSSIRASRCLVETGSLRCHSMSSWRASLPVDFSRTSEASLGENPRAEERASSCGEERVERASVSSERWDWERMSGRREEIEYTSILIK